MGRDDNPMAGHCYVASEALYHLLGGKESGWYPMRMRMPDGIVHWWLANSDGDVLDPTHDQFDNHPNYTDGRSGGFLTREPSKRAQELINRVKHDTMAESLPDDLQSEAAQEHFQLEKVESGGSYRGWDGRIDVLYDELLQVYNVVDADPEFTPQDEYPIVGSIVFYVDKAVELVDNPDFDPSKSWNLENNDLYHKIDRGQHVHVEELFVDPAYRSSQAFMMLVQPVIATGLPIDADFENAKLQQVFMKLVERGKVQKSPVFQPRDDTWMAVRGFEQQRDAAYYAMNLLKTGWMQDFDELMDATSPDRDEQYYEDDTRAWSDLNKGQFLYRNSIPYVLMDGQLYVGRPNEAHAGLYSALKRQGVSLAQMKQGLWGWIDPDTDEVFTHTDIAGFGQNWHNDDAIRDAWPDRIKLAGTQPVERMVSEDHAWHFDQYLNRFGRFAWVYKDGTLYCGDLHKDIMREMRSEGLDPFTGCVYGWVDPANPTNSQYPYEIATDYGTQTPELEDEVHAFFSRYSPQDIRSYLRHGDALAKTSMKDWYRPDDESRKYKGDFLPLSNENSVAYALIGDQLYIAPARYHSIILDYLKNTLGMSMADMKHGWWGYYDSTTGESFEHSDFADKNNWHSIDLNQWLPTAIDVTKLVDKTAGIQYVNTDGQSYHGMGLPFIYDPLSDTMYVGTSETYHIDLMKAMKRNLSEYLDNSEWGEAKPYLVGGRIDPEDTPPVTLYDFDQVTPEISQRVEELTSEVHPVYDEEDEVYRAKVSHWPEIDDDYAPSCPECDKPLYPRFKESTGWLGACNECGLTFALPLAKDSKVAAAVPTQGWIYDPAEDRFVTGNEWHGGLLRSFFPNLDKDQRMSLIYGWYQHPRGMALNENDPVHIYSDNYGSVVTDEAAKERALEWARKWYDDHVQGLHEVKYFDSKTATTIKEDTDDPIYEPWDGNITWVYDPQTDTLVLGTDYHAKLIKRNLRDEEPPDRSYDDMEAGRWHAGRWHHMSEMYYPEYGPIPEYIDKLITEWWDANHRFAPVNTAKTAVEQPWKHDEQEYDPDMLAIYMIDPDGKLHWGEWTQTHNDLAQQFGFHDVQDAVDSGYGFGARYEDGRMVRFAKGWPFFAFGYVDGKLYTDKHGHPFILWAIRDKMGLGGQDGKDRFYQWLKSVPQAWGLAEGGHVEWYSDSVNTGDAGSKEEAVVLLKRKGIISENTDEFGEVEHDDQIEGKTGNDDPVEWEWVTSFVYQNGRFYSGDFHPELIRKNNVDMKQPFLCGHIEQAGPVSKRRYIVDFDSVEVTGMHDDLIPEVMDQLREWYPGIIDDTPHMYDSVNGADSLTSMYENTQAKTAIEQPWKYGPDQYVGSFVYQNGKAYVDEGSHRQIMKRNNLTFDQPFTAGELQTYNGQMYATFFSGALGEYLDPTLNDQALTSLTSTLGQTVEGIDTIDGQKYRPLRLTNTTPNHRQNLSLFLDDMSAQSDSVLALAQLTSQVKPDLHLTSASTCANSRLNKMTGLLNVQGNPHMPGTTYPHQGCLPGDPPAYMGKHISATEDVFNFPGHMDTQSRWRLSDNVPESDSTVQWPIQPVERQEGVHLIWLQTPEGQRFYFPWHYSHSDLSRLNLKLQIRDAINQGYSFGVLNPARGEFTVRADSLTSKVSDTEDRMNTRWDEHYTANPFLWLRWGNEPDSFVWIGDPEITHSSMRRNYRDKWDQMMEIQEGRQGEYYAGRAFPDGELVNWNEEPLPDYVQNDVRETLQNPPDENGERVTLPASSSLSYRVANDFEIPNTPADEPHVEYVEQPPENTGLTMEVPFIYYSPNNTVYMIGGDHTGWHDQIFQGMKRDYGIGVTDLRNGALLGEGYRHPYMLPIIHQNYGIVPGEGIKIWLRKMFGNLPKSFEGWSKSSAIKTALKEVEVETGGAHPYGDIPFIYIQPLDTVYWTAKSGRHHEILSWIKRNEPQIYNQYVENSRYDTIFFGECVPPLSHDEPGLLNFYDLQYENIDIETMKRAFPELWQWITSKFGLMTGYSKVAAPQVNLQHVPAMTEPDADYRNQVPILFDQQTGTLYYGDQDGMHRDLIKTAIGTNLNAADLQANQRLKNNFQAGVINSDGTVVWYGEPGSIVEQAAQNLAHQLFRTASAIEYIPEPIKLDSTRVPVVYDPDHDIIYIGDEGGSHPTLFREAIGEYMHMTEINLKKKDVYDRLAAGIYSPDEAPKSWVTAVPGEMQWFYGPPVSESVDAAIRNYVESPSFPKNEKARMWNESKISTFAPAEVKWVGYPTKNWAIWVWHIPTNTLYFGSGFSTYHRTIMRELEPNLSLKDMMPKFLLGELDELSDGTVEVSDRAGDPYPQQSIAQAVTHAWQQTKQSKTANIQWMDDDAPEKRDPDWTAFIYINGNLYLSSKLIHPKMMRELGLKATELRSPNTLAGWLHQGAGVAAIYSWDENELNEQTTPETLAHVEQLLQQEFPHVQIVDPHDYHSTVNEWEYNQAMGKKTSRYYEFTEEKDAESRWGGLPFIVTPEGRLIVGDDPEEHHRALARSVGLTAHDIETAGILYPDSKFTILWGWQGDVDELSDLLTEVPDSVWDGYGFNLLSMVG